MNSERVCDKTPNEYLCAIRITFLNALRKDIDVYRDCPEEELIELLGWSKVLLRPYGFRPLEKHVGDSDEGN